ncbi:MAG: peptidylprolyl isomerase [Candidatus Brocadiaceae bacterium]|jgi:cyclophilin family peptidyl-prolyl cis-trans isomerase
MVGSFLSGLFGSRGSGTDDSPETEARVRTSLGTFSIALYEARAPNTVANFMHLASTGFYDGLTFHRVIEGFMIQAGCPKGDGTGGPGWTIPDELAEDLTHDAAGVVSMANAGPDTGGSQFFITLVATPWLDGKHAVFGRVQRGMETVQQIGSVETDAGDRPVEPVVIEELALFRAGKRLTEELPRPETA